MRCDARIGGQRGVQLAVADVDANHVRCAVFELPFRSGEFFGPLEVDALLEAAPAPACPCGLCREGCGAPLTAAEAEGAMLAHRVQRAPREPATPL